MPPTPSVSHLRASRERRGLSQRALAEAAGISRQSLFAIESGGADPSVSVALALAAALELPVEALFGAAPAPAGSVRAELAARAAAGVRVALAFLGERWVAHPLDHSAQGPGLSADGVLRAGGAAGARAQVELLKPPELARDNVLLAGCDPGLGVLADRLNRATGPGRFVWLCVGSGAALEALRARQVHVAGIHLGPNAPAAHKALGGHPVSLVTLARWETGLAVAKGNPRRLTGAGQLSRPGIRLVSRERGAGARLLLERALAASGVEPRRVLGRAREAHSHFEAAFTVAVGAADAAVAMGPAAIALGLDFVPWGSERFDLVLPAESASDPRVVRLREALAGASFRRELGALGGYDTSESGREASAGGP